MKDYNHMDKEKSDWDESQPFEDGFWGYIIS